MKLRNYQIESIKLLRESFASGHNNIILALPTGSGKTVIFSEMVRLAFERGTKTLILTDRIELFKATIASVLNHNVPIQELNAKTKIIDADAMITVAMVETFKRRDIVQYQPQLIICDEAHKGNFTPLIKKYTDARIIGVTATPIGLHITKLYKDIIQPIDTPELVEQGYLSKCVAYQMQDDFSDLEEIAGEYSEQSQFKHYNQSKLYSGVVTEWKRYGQNKKTIVFNVNIEHTEKMNQQFVDAGIDARFITSNTPHEQRQQILTDYSNGLFPVLNNCGILTTGYDEPSIEVVIMNRKTKSLPLFLQCLGRGSRIYPDKPHFTVLDFGMNHNEHGMWNEARTWTLAEKKKKSKDLNAPLVKTCEGCGAMLSIKCSVCEFCGFMFPVVKNEPSVGVMVAVTPTEYNVKGKKLSQLSLDELLYLERIKRYKSSFIWRIIRSKNMIREYARLKGYSDGWIWRQNRELNNSHYNDYTL